MTALSDFFTFPWIKILLQEHLYTLDDPLKANKTKDYQRPFRAYIKEIYEGGNMMIITDGFNEVRAKLLPVCKSSLKERYPSFCQLYNNKSIQSFLVAIKKYRFCLKQKGQY